MKSSCRVPSLRHLRTCAGLLITLAVSAGVQGSESIFRFSGFGTLGYVQTDSADILYLTGIGSEGADDDGSFKVDSRLGLQADAVLTDRFSATGQLLARQEETGDIRPGVEWAFVKARLTPEISVRAGRIGAPVFMVSDFREVGYANILLRPPEDTYVQVPIRTGDGADIIGQFEWNETLINVQAFAGSRRQRFEKDRSAEIKDLIGVNIALEQGIARLRLGHATFMLDTDFPELQPLSAALDGAATQLPSLQAIAIDFNDEPKRSSFSGIGLELDLDPIFVSAELTQRRTRDSFTADTTGWYIAAGFRWNNVTPYASVSALRQDSRTRSLPFPPIPQLAPLEAGTNIAYRSAAQETVALGLRWDLAQNLAVKAQIENVERDVVGDNFEHRSTDADGTSVQLYSLALDFVF